MYGLIKFLILAVSLVEYTRAQAGLIAFNVNFSISPPLNLAPLWFIGRINRGGLIPSIYDSYAKSFWLYFGKTNFSVTALRVKEENGTFTTESVQDVNFPEFQYIDETILAVAMTSIGKSTWWLTKTVDDQYFLYYCDVDSSRILHVPRINFSPQKIIKIFPSGLPNKIYVLYEHYSNRKEVYNYVVQEYALYDYGLQATSKKMIYDDISGHFGRLLDQAVVQNNDGSITWGVVMYNKRTDHIIIEVKQFSDTQVYMLSVDINPKPDTKKINCTLASERKKFFYNCFLPGTIIYGDFDVPKLPFTGAKTLPHRILDLPEQNKWDDPIPLHVRSNDSIFTVLYDKTHKPNFINWDIGKLEVTNSSKSAEDILELRLGRTEKKNLLIERGLVPEIFNTDNFVWLNGGGGEITALSINEKFSANQELKVKIPLFENRNEDIVSVAMTSLESDTWWHTKTQKDEHFFTYYDGFYIVKARISSDESQLYNEKAVIKKIFPTSEENKILVLLSAENSIFLSSYEMRPTLEKFIKTGESIVTDEIAGNILDYALYQKSDESRINEIIVGIIYCLPEAKEILLSAYSKDESSDDFRKIYSSKIVPDGHKLSGSEYRCSIAFYNDLFFSCFSPGIVFSDSVIIRAKASSGANDELKVKVYPTETMTSKPIIPLLLGTKNNDMYTLLYTQEAQKENELYLLTKKPSPNKIYVHKKIVCDGVREGNRNQLAYLNNKLFNRKTRELDDYYLANYQLSFETIHVKLGSEDLSAKNTSEPDWSEILLEAPDRYVADRIINPQQISYIYGGYHEKSKLLQFLSLNLKSSKPELEGGREIRVLTLKLTESHSRLDFVYREESIFIYVSSNMNIYQKAYTISGRENKWVEDAHFTKQFNLESRKFEHLEAEERSGEVNEEVKEIIIKASEGDSESVVAAVSHDLNYIQLIRFKNKNEEGEEFRLILRLKYTEFLASECEVKTINWHRPAGQESLDTLLIFLRSSKNHVTADSNYFLLTVNINFGDLRKSRDEDAVEHNDTRLYRTSFIWAFDMTNSVRLGQNEYRQLSKFHHFMFPIKVIDSSCESDACNDKSLSDVSNSEHYKPPEKNPELGNTQFTESQYSSKPPFSGDGGGGGKGVQAPDNRQGPDVDKKNSQHAVIKYASIFVVALGSFALTIRFFRLGL